MAIHPSKKWITFETLKIQSWAFCYLAKPQVRLCGLVGHYLKYCSILFFLLLIMLLCIAPLGSCGFESKTQSSSSLVTRSLPHCSKELRTVLYFVHVCITVKGALVFCCSAGQLITLVWGLLTGHQQSALCCCHEPFTPSSSTSNGTSESIKTIITANSTESKEIILGHQGKCSGGFWIYLSREQLDMHLARQPITVSISCICLVWIHWQSAGFSSLQTNCLFFGPADL